MKNVLLFGLHLVVAIGMAFAMNRTFRVPPFWWVWFPISIGTMFVYRRALAVLELERRGQPAAMVDAKTLRGEPVKVSEAAVLLSFVRGACIMIILAALFFQFRR